VRQHDPGPRPTRMSWVAGGASGPLAPLAPALARPGRGRGVQATQVALDRPRAGSASPGGRVEGCCEGASAPVEPRGIGRCRGTAEGRGVTAHGLTTPGSRPRRGRGARVAACAGSAPRLRPGAPTPRRSRPARTRPVEPLREAPRARLGMPEAAHAVCVVAGWLAEDRAGNQRRPDCREGMIRRKASPPRAAGIRPCRATGTETKVVPITSPAMMKTG